MQSENFYFTDRRISSLLLGEFGRLKEFVQKHPRILDVGCGDGVMIYDLQKMHILEGKCSVVGVDISQKNINVAKKRIKGSQFYVADASNLPFTDNSFDFVYSWMVIEHLLYPVDMVKEIARVMKKDAKCYISTIIRKKNAVYFYRKNKHFVLDPTHVNEFQSEAEFVELIRKAGLKVVRLEKEERKYSLFELIFKILIKLRVIHPRLETRDFFKDHLWANFLRRSLMIPIPGFYQLEALCEIKKV